jgi:hypothetical protein
MPRYGGFSSYPLRYGGGDGGSGKTLHQRVFESIAAQRGSAYDQTTTTAVGLENFLFAKAIVWDGYYCSQRLANNFLPTKATVATGMLPRWERIFNAPPALGDTEVQRRARISAAWLSVVQSNIHQSVDTVLVSALGVLYSGTYTYQAPATALTYWPGASTNTPSLPWYSSILHVDILVNLPASYTSSSGPTAAWWAAVGAFVPPLDAMLPAYVTFDWYINSSHGGLGFYLDEFDLDLEIFDV